jgi:hypothetical protein
VISGSVFEGQILGAGEIIRQNLHAGLKRSDPGGIGSYTFSAIYHEGFVRAFTLESDFRTVFRTMIGP